MLVLSGRRSGGFFFGLEPITDFCGNNSVPLDQEQFPSFCKEQNKF